jgi:hypothetical protein
LHSEVNGKSKLEFIVRRKGKVRPQADCSGKPATRVGSLALVPVAKARAAFESSNELAKVCKPSSEIPASVAERTVLAASGETERRPDRAGHAIVRRTDGRLVRQRAGGPAKSREQGACGSRETVPVGRPTRPSAPTAGSAAFPGCYRNGVLGFKLDDLVARFLDGTVPREEWTHAAHLAVGAWYVHRFGPEEAIARLRSGIRALNDRHGTPNTDTSGYHESITVAYVRLIDRFLSTGELSDSLESRLPDLLRGPLADRAFLFRFWSREVLMSPSARASWTPPNLSPLDLPNESSA